MAAKLELGETKTGITVESILTEELYGVLIQSAVEAAPLDQAAVWRRLRAAEDYYERRLQLRFGLVDVYSGILERRAIASGPLKLPDGFDESAVVYQPAVDYEPQQWDHNRWGRIFLNWRPVRQVYRLVFAYPGTRPVFSVPPTWVKADRDSAVVNIIPADGDPIMLQFNSFFLSVAAGGRAIPYSMFVDYQTGYSREELEYQHQDLLEGVRLRCVLNLAGILANTLTGGGTGGALSLDGLSHSQSFGGKYGAYSGMIEAAVEREKEILESWESHEQGVPMAFA